MVKSGIWKLSSLANFSGDRSVTSLEKCGNMMYHVIKNPSSNSSMAKKDNVYIMQNIYLPILIGVLYTKSHRQVKLAK